MRVALLTIGDERWMAGEVIVRNVLTGVRDLGLADTTFVLLSNSAAVDDQLRRRYPGADAYLQCPAPRRFSPRWVTSQVSQRVFGRDLVLDRFLREQGVDVVFGVCFLSKYAHAATLSWIPDFQHLHLPEMFSAQERAGRDLMFRKTAELLDADHPLEPFGQAGLRAAAPPVERAGAGALAGEPDFTDALRFGSAKDRGALPPA